MVQVLDLNPNKPGSNLRNSYSFNPIVNETFRTKKQSQRKEGVGWLAVLGLTAL